MLIVKYVVEKSCLFSELDQFFRILDHEHKLAKKNKKNHPKSFYPRTGLNMGEMIKKISNFVQKMRVVPGTGPQIFFLRWFRTGE